MRRRMKGLQQEVVFNEALPAAGQLSELKVLAALSDSCIHRLPLHSHLGLFLLVLEKPRNPPSPRFSFSFLSLICCSWTSSNAQDVSSLA